MKPGMTLTTIYATTALLAVALNSGCDRQRSKPKNIQASKAELAAKSVKFTRNAEIDNLKRRLQLTGEPGKVGFITLLNSAGQPIIYTDVKGKVSSGTKRLTKTWRKVRCDKGQAIGDCVVQASGDEGTYGSSAPYIYFWDTRDKYYQWNSDYLYTDQPQRLSIEPLVVNIAPAPAAAK